MCLAALWSPVGKGAKAIVASLAGPAFAGPTFLAEYAFHHVPLSRFGSFFYELTFDCIQSFTETIQTLRTSFIDLVKVLKQAVTEIWVVSQEN